MEQQSMINIILAADHDLVRDTLKQALERDALKQALERERDMCVIDEASNGQQLIDVCDRLIPDIIRSFQKKEKVNIRSPKAIRPWQHVLEPLSGYMQLAELLYLKGCKYAEPWNFGPSNEDAQPVELIVEKIAELWGGNSKWSKDDNSYEHEATFLKLSCNKAFKNLNWKPTKSLREGLEKTYNWISNQVNLKKKLN